MTRLEHFLALGLGTMVMAVPAVAQTPAARRPTLVVLITIDQFRADYLDRFATQLTGGLGRLARGGARFTNAHHDHAITETAPGHATLLSGRFPRSTGIMANRVGVEDPASPLVEASVGPGASPARFVGTTLVDWLAAQNPRSRAFSVSSKDRGAILPIGRSKSQVYWYSTDGRFTTSQYYRDSVPPWVRAFNNRRMPQSFAGKSWTLLLPESAYAEPDTVFEESGGEGIVFPHTLPSDSAATANVVRGTPFIDQITLAFAIHGVQSLALGSGPQTDVIALSLSGTDYIGHRYGPDSREMHDQVLRLDRALGTFLDSLYRLRDSAHVTIALTADHGMGTIPELAPASMKPAPTRVTLYGLLPAFDSALVKLKVDTLAVDIDQQIVSFNRAAFARANVNADSVIDAFAKAALRLPGVRRVDRFKALLADTSSDPIARRWSHQFPANAPVDLVVTLTPGSIWGTIVATHGTPYEYDSNVPLIFFGAGVRPGRHAEFVRTVDLAPTLAEIAGVRPTERIDGVVLRTALP